MCDNYSELVLKARAVADRALHDMLKRGHDPVAAQSAARNRYEQEFHSILSRMSPAKRAKFVCVGTNLIK